MVEFDPYSYATHQNPYPIYRRLRDEAPLYHNEKYGFWAVSRFEDCKAVLKNFSVFSSAKGIELQGRPDVAYSDVMTTDPPDHTRLRHVMSELFQPAKIAELQELTRTTARSLLAQFSGAGRMDMIADYAGRLPMLIMCRLLNYPREDDARIMKWTNDAVHTEEGVQGLTPAGIEGLINLGKYNEDVIARRSPAPLGEDLVSHLIAALRAGRINHLETMGYLQLLAFAGHETTTKLMGNAVYQLWKHPDALQRVLNDPSMIAGAIEETLRYDSSVQLQARTTTREFEMHGRVVPAGSKMAVLFGSAGRDERKYERADVFDISRNSRDHIGFGFGLHSCLGAPLARLEARIALEELFKLTGRYDVDESNARIVHSANVHGFQRLPIAFRPAVVAKELADA
jgi:cytochrome P450